MKEKNFNSLGLSDAALKTILSKGFEEPTKIQVAAIPIILNSDDDIVGQAQTGTGKTAAFGLPIMDIIEEVTDKGVKVLVVTPTRELAVQVSEELNSLRQNKKMRVVPIYGGTSIGRQIKRLKEGVDIVVGTPGRLIDLINRKILKLGQLKFLVLDEADEMLNMGFVDDIEKIIKHANPDKRTLLFSATMPKSILEIAKKYMKNYQVIRVKQTELTTNLTDQIYFEVNRADKFEALTRIIDIEPDFYGIVFCRTKSDVDQIADKLIERGYDAEGLHGDLSQFIRERIYSKFKQKSTRILVATDVAARGLDVNDLSHVINYSIPQDPESYVHRIGRTGRAGKKGTAITFVTPAEYRGLLHIRKVANTTIRKETLPAVDDIVKAKENQIKDEVRALIEEDELSAFENLAMALLQAHSPEVVVKGLLKYFLKDEISSDSYSDIKNVSIDKQGKTRLFVAKGRKDGYNVKKIIDLIQSEVDVPSYRIKDIKLFDSYSFVSMPFEEAEMLIFGLSRKNKNKRPIVTHAKPKNKSSDKKRHNDKQRKGRRKRK